MAAENKIEEIGKVRLDYGKYSGKDYYSEGAVEDTLLDIVKSKSSAEYDRIIEERKSWPFLYHLSSLRENIVDWIPMHKGCKVLEVGSGCGAVTGALARKAGSVTCVELSKKRSLINAYRHREWDNITIHVGNFQDIEPELPGDFDYICLIGVFEYGKSYIGGDRPYETFLEKLFPHLAPGGRIVIAIENKYGLKYFAGCREDHLGTYFSGIENYVSGGEARTFSRNGLERIFSNCGVGEYHFYYPYPDYKFMTALYSDGYLPGKGELFNNVRNFDSDRLLLFNEKNAFDGMAEDGLFPLFSNSYAVIVGRGFDVKYVKYSNDRAPEYAVRTEILESWFGSRQEMDVVRKYPMGEAAEEHVRGMAAACESLKDRYQGGKLAVNECELVEVDGQFCAQFEYVDGISLLELMDRCLERDDLEAFQRYFREFVERVGYNSEYPAADFDLVFGNILITPRGWETADEKEAQGRSFREHGSRNQSMQRSLFQNPGFLPGDGQEGRQAQDYPEEDLLQGTWTLIDYEWTFGKPMDRKRLAFRAAYWYLLEDEKRKKIGMDWIRDTLSVTEREVKAFWEEEGEFQRFVTGERASLAEMREKIGNRIIRPLDWLERYQDSQDVNRVQIYEDRGQGYKEEESYFVRDAYQGDWIIELELKVSGDVKMLRIDPGMYACSVKIREMTFNGATVPLHKRKLLYANGSIVRPTDKAQRDCPGIVFATEDPNININVERLERKEENILRVRLEIVRLPLQIAQDMEAGCKRRF